MAESSTVTREATPLERIATLEKIVRDTLWMARRYAHGRQTYSVSMYNTAARAAARLGLASESTDGSIFALDGGDDGAGSPGYSGLTPEEFEVAAAALNRVGTTPHPCRFSPAAQAALATREDARGR